MEHVAGGGMDLDRIISTSIQIGCRKDAEELIEGMTQPWLRLNISEILCPASKEGKIGIVKERERHGGNHSQEI